MKTWKILNWMLYQFMITEMKNKIRTYGDKFSTNFCGLNVTEDGVECKSFTVNYIDSLPVHENKYCLLVHLEFCL